MNHLSKNFGRKRRHGAAVVEAAIVLPVVILLVFGFIELGYCLNSQHVLYNAARQGARAAVRLENSNAEVEAAVLGALNNAIAVDPNSVTVRISKLDTAGAEQYQVMNLNENEQGETIRVMVTVGYAQFHPPSNHFGLASQTLTSAVVMQRQK